MAYCTDPKNHKEYWWADPGGFTHFDYKRKRIVPSKTAWLHCSKCHMHWGTTNKDLVAKLPTRERRDAHGK